jgi:hypothetical protein
LIILDFHVSHILYHIQRLIKAHRRALEARNVDTDTWGTTTLL